MNLRLGEDRPTPRVLLIREWEAQLSSSGCCGRIEGEFLEAADGNGEGRRFPERRKSMEGAGRLYRALTARYGNRVDIRVVDPRNLVSLVPTLLRDAWRHRSTPATALRSLCSISVQSVVVNGELVSSGEWPPVTVVYRALERDSEGLVQSSEPRGAGRGGDG